MKYLKKYNENILDSKDLNSLKLKIIDEKHFKHWIKKFKELGILGDFVPVGTSMDIGYNVDELKYETDCGEDSMIEFNVTLENVYLVENFPDCFK